MTLLRARRPLLLALLGFALAAPGGAVAATVPSGFEDALVADVSAPTALAFAPDGRLFVTSREGRLRVLAGGSTSTVLDLSGRVCTDWERGLLGVAVDPGVATNGHVYLYYSFKRQGACGSLTSTTPVNRVSRFTLAGGSIDPATELVLIDNIRSPEGNHNGGDLQFGKDGMLYVSIGDGGCDYKDTSRCGALNTAARDTHMLLGKVLRITRSGGVPADNPWAATGGRCALTGSTDPGRHCQETFAWGLRNPFRLAFDPTATGTRFFINDVGQRVWEEVDEGAAGADYGWNTREGRCATNSTSSCGSPPSGMTNPIYAYGHGDGCVSITGGAFVPRGAFGSGSSYDGTYLYGDYGCGRIFRLTRSSSGTWSSSSFVTGMGEGGPIAMSFGPHAGGSSLYYTTFSGGGEVRRVTYTASTNRPPSARVRATPASGPTPLSVAFDGSGSSDPDPGDTLTYVWEWGDGSLGTQTATPTTRHVYTRAGSFTATLRVRDGRGALSDPVTVTVDAGNQPPTASIDAPSTDLRFRVGEALALSATASDPEDGPLPASSMRWEVLRRHDQHTHPFLGPVSGDDIPFTAPAPEDLAAAASSSLEARLTVTDSAGATTTVTRAILPNDVELTFATRPTGLELEVGDLRRPGPFAVTAWEGQVVPVGASAQTGASGTSYAFAAWSDGGGARHDLIAPGEDAAYTATFTAQGGPPAPSGTGLTGEYFDNKDLTALKLTRLDPLLAFAWGSGSPASGIGVDSFSVRWRGSIEPRYSESYRLSVLADDGVRVWIDGVRVIDAWRDGTRETTATVALSAGRRHDLRVEYYENGGGAKATLAWSSASQARETVPTSALRSPG